VATITMATMTTAAFVSRRNVAQMPTTDAS
jgi:hypothetical protein